MEVGETYPSADSFCRGYCRAEGGRVGKPRCCSMAHLHPQPDLQKPTGHSLQHYFARFRGCRLEMRIFCHREVVTYDL